MNNTQFKFTVETLAQLVTVSANKNAAVALAAREAAAAKLTQREFGLALQNASASLGCTSTVYGLALTMAKEGASLKNIEKAMDDKYKAMREANRVKREEAEAKKATEAAAADAAGIGNIGNLKNLTPIEQAQVALEKARVRVTECKAELEKAEQAVVNAESALNAVKKADADAAAELKRMEEAKKEIAPILSILAELKPLTKKEAEEAFKAQRDAVHAAKKARKTA